MLYLPPYEKSGRNKNRLIFSVIGAVTLIIVLIVGVSAYYTENEPITSSFVFAFASDRSGAGDIFVMDKDGTLQNLISHPEADWDPSWSPDGQWLVFTSHRSGNSDIWLWQPQLDEANQPPRNLTHDLAWDYSPTWSPSGNSVAFVSERDGDAEIFVQHLEEDIAIQLTFNQEMDRMPVWVPGWKVHRLCRRA